jgi:acetaldehyde dehydrogenase
MHKGPDHFGRHSVCEQGHNTEGTKVTGSIGPFVVPPVNLDQDLDTTNVNVVTCGDQATIPIVAAVSRVVRVPYAEIVASIAWKSAGPGTPASRRPSSP